MATKRNLYLMMQNIESQLGHDTLRDWICSASTSYGILQIKERGRAFLDNRPAKEQPLFVDFLANYIELRFCCAEEPEARRVPFKFEGDEPCEFTANYPRFSL
jgi:hypothetical protein